MRLFKQFMASLLAVVILIGAAPMRTQAASVSKISVDYIYTDQVDIKVETSGSGTLQSYEYRVKYNNKVVKSGTSKVLRRTSGGSDRFCRASIPTNSAVQVSVRAKIGGSWTPWSGYSWVVPKVTNARCVTYTNKNVRLSWTKVKGVTDYAVYVTTKPSGTWKKVKNTKGRSITIRTYDGKNVFKTGKTYYVKVLARKQSGSGYVKSKGYNKSWYMFKFKFTRK